jgi:hypothetical protein
MRDLRAVLPSQQAAPPAGCFGERGLDPYEEGPMNQTSDASYIASRLITALQVASATGNIHDLTRVVQTLIDEGIMARAAERGETVSDVIRRALDRYVEERTRASERFFADDAVKWTSVNGTAPLS